MLISQPVNESRASLSLLEAINAALAMDDSTTAQRLCEARLAVAPDDPDAHRYLGQVYARQGDVDAARAAARHATELAPNDPRCWSDFGRVWVLSSDWPAAVRCFRQSVSLQADYADGWHNLGAALKQLGEHERAIVWRRNFLTTVRSRRRTCCSGSRSHTAPTISMPGSAWAMRWRISDMLKWPPPAI